MAIAAAFVSVSHACSKPLGCTSYFFSIMSTVARVVSQSRRIVHLVPAWSNAMVKFSTGDGSLAMCMSARVRSNRAPG